MAIKGASHSEKKYGSSKDKSKQPPTKVVIRRLPPDMTAETFREQVSPLPDHDYLCFVPADLGLSPHAFSRAYLNLLRLDDVITFRDRFDGYVFVDKQGFEYPAVVEFAPYQRIPRRRSRRPDPKSGTIEDDPDYKAFLQACEQPEEVTPPTWEQVLEEIEKKDSEQKDANVVTPLVTYVCRRRAEKKEERKRRELERRKEEARKAREKLTKEKRDTKDKGRYDSKDSTSKVFWNEEYERKRDDGFVSKRYDDKPRDKYAKETRSEKDDKYKRRDKEERWKDTDKPKREDKYKQAKEDRRKDGDWEDKKKKIDRRQRTSDSSSEPSGAVSREVPERSGEAARGAGDAADPVRPAADTPPKQAPPRPEPADARKERKEAKAERVRTGASLKNKDRPSLAIYRPGMGKYSSRRLRERDSQSSSPTPAGEAAGDDDRPRGTPPPPPRNTLVFRRSRAPDA